MKYIALLITIITVIFHGCSEKPTEVGGGASGNGNALISGLVLNSNGTPAINANIIFVPVSIDPTTSNGSPTVVTAKTDGQGFYGINTPLSGTWNVFANDGIANYAFNDSIPLTGDTAVLPPLQLKSKGKLQIVFKTQPQHDPRLIDVIFWGTDRVLVPVSRDGLMNIDDLAEGTYPVRIKLSTEYSVIDTHFTIRAGETTGRDTIELRYLNIPVVTGLNGIYDTLNGKVQLTWNGADTSMIAGYNVYRSTIDSNSNNILLNTIPVTTASYLDSLAVFGRIYIYRIKAVGRNGDLCPVFSTSASIHAVSPTLVVTKISLGTFNTTNDTVSIKDSVGFIATLTNPTRQNVEIAWFADTFLVPYKIKIIPGVSSSVETLKVAWENFGVHKIKVRITDNANSRWYSDEKQCIVIQDLPIANAGNDTMVKAGNSITLNGNAIDRFGVITEWAWDIGNTGSFSITSSGTTTLNTVAGLLNMNYLSVLRVRDDDGNYGYDTIRVAIFDQYMPITLTEIKVSGVGTDTAVVSWNSGYAAFGKVQYGKTTACSDGEASSGLKVSHTTTLSGLTSDALYFYKVISSNSEDADTSAVFAFSTKSTTNSVYTIKKLPSGMIPSIDGSMQDWSRDFMVGTISGDDNVFARTSNDPLDPSTEWNGELFAAWDSSTVYFAIRVTVDDVYKIGNGFSPYMSDNIKINPGGAAKAFYLWSNGVLNTNPACVFEDGVTLNKKVNSTGNSGLPIYEFSLSRSVLTPSDGKEFRLNIGTEDTDATNSAESLLGFGAYYTGSKQEWGANSWDNPANYPVYKLKD